MAVVLAAIFLFALFSQGLAIPTIDATVQDGGQTRGTLDGVSRYANIVYKEATSGTRVNEASEKGLISCIPKLYLIYDATSNILKLYSEYLSVRNGLNAKRDRCQKIGDQTKRGKCLKDLEEKEEKPAYDRISERFRALAGDFVTDTTGFFKCIMGL